MVCLSGELGSGKTTFVQGLGQAIGYKGRAASPTFVLAKLYRGRRWNLHHVDLYRVAPGEAAGVGLEDMFGDPQAICAVEWPESARGFLPPERMEIEFNQGKAHGERRITLRGAGRRPQEILRRLGKSYPRDLERSKSGG